MNQNTLPSIDQLLAGPCTSYWLKNAIHSSLQRDLVDAARDAALLNALLQRRCQDNLQSF
jgi:hypothetical protein